MNDKIVELYQSQIDAMVDDARRDAIDEFQKWYTDLMNNPPSAIVPYTVIFDKLEQTKRRR